MPKNHEKRPSRTRGYYTFRRDYPGGKRGDFPAESPPARLSPGGKIIAAVCAVLVFLIAFVGTDLWIRQAKRVPVEAEIGTGATVAYAEELTTLPPAVPAAEG